MKNLLIAFLMFGLMGSPTWARNANYRKNAVTNSGNAAVNKFNENSKKDGSDTMADPTGTSTLSGTVQESTINPGAKKGQSSQSGGSAANAMMAAMLLAACLAPCPKCAMPLCAMSALAAAQAAHDAGAAGESSNVAGITNKDGVTTPSPYANGKSNYADTRKKALDKLKAEGYQLTSSSLINPDGSITPLSAFNSSGSMAAAGLDQNSIDQVKKITAEAEKAYGLSAKRDMGVAVSSGGGGGSSGNSPDSASSEDSTPAAFNPFAIGDQKKKDLMSGKTVMFDGEPIGVAGSNIFETVHDAYQKRRRGNQFIEGSGPSSDRVPASVNGSK